MATLTIRQLDDNAYHQLRERARANNRSLEAEARQVILEAASGSGDDEWFEKVTKLREEMRDKYGELPDSTDLIRQMRDEE